MRSESLQFLHQHKLKIAPLWRRVIAQLVDGVILLFFISIPYVNLALFPAYLFVRDAWPPLGGKSLGKRVVNIKVISLVYQHDLIGNYTSSINRNLSLVLFPIDVLSQFLTKHRQRLGDQLTQTVVVKNSVELKNYLKSKERNNKRFIRLNDYYDRDVLK